MRQDSLAQRVEVLEKKVAQLQKEFLELLGLVADISVELTDQGSRIKRLEAFTGINEVFTFLIGQRGDDSMAITGIAPGATGTFTATPLGPDGNPVPLPAGAQPPVWQSSDATNAPVVAASDGLSATVSVPESTAGGSFSLTVSSPDLPGQPSGSASVPINVPPPPQVAGFQINQTI